MPRLLPAILLALLAGPAPLPAFAGDEPANRLLLLVDNQAAQVVGSQAASVADEASDPHGNRITVLIEGDGNGGLMDVSLPASPRHASLQSGTLVQSGRLNTIDLSVRGDSNLFAALQSGTANALVADMTGTGNRLAVRQQGSGQMAHVTQRGRGNFVGITQTGW